MLEISAIIVGSIIGLVIAYRWVLPMASLPGAQWNGPPPHAAMNLRHENMELRKQLIVAFVQGAQWWEFRQTRGTMWASDRNLAEAEAMLRQRNGTLGVVRATEGGQ